MYNHTTVIDHRNVKHGFKLAQHTYLSKFWHIFRERTTTKMFLTQQYPRAQFQVPGLNPTDNKIS